MDPAPAAPSRRHVHQGPRRRRPPPAEGASPPEGTVVLERRQDSAEELLRNLGRAVEALGRRTKVLENQVGLLLLRLGTG